MTENEAISMMRYRIDTASQILGKGMNGKAYEDMEMAISALEEIQQYRKIGTVEECREAVDKQKPKKPVLRNDNGKLRKSCPVCGCFFSPLSRSCPKCGQAIRLGENKEGMRDE